MNAKEAAALAKSKSAEKVVADIERKIKEAATNGAFGFSMDVDYMDDILPTVLTNLKYKGFTVRYWDNAADMCNTWSVSW